MRVQSEQLRYSTYGASDPGGSPARDPRGASNQRATERAPASCDGTELDRLDPPARYPQPRRRMSAALGPSPIASVRAR